MKTSTIAILTALTIAIPNADAAKQVQVFEPNSQGKVTLDGAPDYVIGLIDKIKATDMKGWLLSEVTSSKWLVSGVTIIDDDLILVTLSDGDGQEDVLFDRNSKKRWSIIRRKPLGDWKPEGQRKGDRLSVLPF